MSSSCIFSVVVRLGVLFVVLAVDPLVTLRAADAYGISGIVDLLSGTRAERLKGLELVAVHPDGLLLLDTVTSLATQADHDTSRAAASAGFQILRRSHPTDFETLDIPANEIERARAALEKTCLNGLAPEAARVAALWGLHELGRLRNQPSTHVCMSALARETNPILKEAARELETN